MTAAEAGHAEVAELLVDAGASVTEKNSFGQTALHLCVERQRKPAARTLLRRLTPQLNAPQGALLTAALRSMAAKMPDLVPEALKTTMRFGMPCWGRPDVRRHAKSSRGI